MDVQAYMGSSSIRFDLSIRDKSIFGPERDRYCRHMLDKALLRGENIDPWQMWQRVERCNAVVCKYCRLERDSEYIKHACGWWDRALDISGKTMCFCFCHDDLGYSLDDDDQFVFCNFRKVHRQALVKALRNVNALRIDYIHGNPLNFIKYIASRDGIMIVSDDDYGEMLPHEILSIRPFSGFVRRFKTFAKMMQILRGTAFGQFLRPKYMRRFFLCSKLLFSWRHEGMSNDAVLIHYLQQARAQFLQFEKTVSASKAMAGPPRDIGLSKRVAKFLRYDADKSRIFCDAGGFYCLRHVLQLRRFADVSAADIWNEVTRDNTRFAVRDADGRRMLRAKYTRWSKHNV